MSGEVYIFVNRRRTQVKLLHWEHGGYVMYYKRMEEGTIELPAQGGQVSWAQLVMMVEGVSMKNIQLRKRFSIQKSA